MPVQTTILLVVLTVKGVLVVPTLDWSFSESWFVYFRQSYNMQRDQQNLCSSHTAAF